MGLLKKNRDYSLSKRLSHSSNQKETIGVFISYSSLDKPHAQQLRDSLAENGLKVWFDELEILPGDSLLEKIEQGIKSMDYLIVILTPQSVGSPWVKTELELAFQLQLHSKFQIIPVLLRPCEIPLYLKIRSYADLSSRENYEIGIQKLIQKLIPSKNSNETSSIKSKATNPIWSDSAIPGLVFGQVLANGTLPVRLTLEESPFYKWSVKAISHDAIAGQVPVTFSKITSEPFYFIPLYGGYRGYPFTNLKITCETEGTVFQEEYFYKPVSIVVRLGENLDKVMIELLSPFDSLRWYTQQNVYQKHPQQATLTPSYREHWYYELVPEQDYILSVISDSKFYQFRIQNLTHGKDYRCRRVTVTLGEETLQLCDEI